MGSSSPSAGDSPPPSISYNHAVVVWALQAPVLVAIVWIVEGPPTFAPDSWWTSDVWGWWYAGLVLVALVSEGWPRRWTRQSPEQLRTAGEARLRAEARRAREERAAADLASLRKFDDPHLNVKELFVLHQGFEVLARCKVEAHPTDYVVILVVRGTHDRSTRCTNESDVWLTAALWKAELLARRWYPAEAGARTAWPSDLQ